MLFFGSSFHNTGLFSIRSAGRIGTVNGPIINPHNLHIDGFFATAMNGQNNGVIVDVDVRELSINGLIINDHEDITEQDELVRLQPIIDLQFELIGKTVYVGKSKVGKVEDYVVDTKSLFIQKFYVQPSLLKSVNTGQMIFDRQSIVEVTDKKIVVSGPEQSVKNFISQKLPSSSSLSSASTSSISE